MATETEIARLVKAATDARASLQSMRGPESLIYSRTRELDAALAPFGVRAAYCTHVFYPSTPHKCGRCGWDARTEPNPNDYPPPEAAPTTWG